MKYLVLISLTLLTSCARFKTAESKPIAALVVLKIPQTIDEAVVSDYRTSTFKARDIYRHPAETLKFFDLKPNMKVIEISPANGWYMEIIAPFVSEHGLYIMGAPAASNDLIKKQESALITWSKKHPEIAAKMAVATFNLPADAKLAEPNSVDMVVTFRNVHNWMAKNNEKIAFKSFYKVLKKGGILGLVEHRAPEKNKKDPLAKSGYVRESDVIKMAKAAGFRLVAKSEINANQKDKKDYPDGVWTLPPTLKLKEKDREKYLAIGESDRMTLKFVKP